MRKICSPFIWFAAVVALIALIEGFSLLGVHVVNQAYGADCARVAEGDVAFEEACETFERVTLVTDEALSESGRLVEESGTLARRLLREHTERRRQLEELERERELLLRELLKDE